MATSTAGSDELAAFVAGLRSARVGKAGLYGAYARADCELGREVLSLAREGRGSYLFGEPGRGKTWAAACAVRLAVEEGPATGALPALFVSSAELLGSERNRYRGEAWGVSLDACRTVGILAVDDIGAERATDWAVETLSALIDYRVSRGLPTIFTSNYSIGQLRDLWGGVPGKRVASRIAGACEPKALDGPDRRLA